jgi:hypothetical protein
MSSTRKGGLAMAMQRLQKHSFGFTAASLFLLFICCLLSIAGAWYIWHYKHKPADINPGTASANLSTTSKTYTNNEYGFTFQYPASWRLSEQFQDEGRGHPEGEVQVIASSGVAVTFDTNLGGKGGDCVHDPSDTPHHTVSCSTLEIFAVTPLDRSASLYRYHAKYTPPGTDAQSRYLVFIQNGPAAPTKTGTIIGAVTPGIVRSRTGYVDNSIRGVDDMQSGYFNNPQVRAAETILSSFRLLP